MLEPSTSIAAAFPTRTAEHVDESGLERACAVANDISIYIYIAVCMYLGIYMLLFFHGDCWQVRYHSIRERRKERRRIWPAEVRR
jgi:hypothetical protein